MPSYLALVNWTDQGIRTIKERDIAAGIEAFKQNLVAAGGRLIFYYMLMGEYDLALLVELSDDDAAARLALTAGIGGNFRTRTMRAFTEEETIALIGSLP
jgi:uncharacterized protein with GYD domain